MFRYWEVRAQKSLNYYQQVKMEAKKYRDKFVCFTKPCKCLLPKSVKKFIKMTRDKQERESDDKQTLLKNMKEILSLLSDSAEKVGAATPTKAVKNPMAE
jgi:hypothetical protein